MGPVAEASVARPAAPYARDRGDLVGTPERAVRYQPEGADAARAPISGARGAAGRREARGPGLRPRSRRSASPERRPSFAAPDRMTRLLHTGDLHLADDRPERWRALDAVVDAAADRGADALLLAGDLLDRGGDHRALRARVRETLDDAPCPVLLLPGNHDLEAYAPGQDWGGPVRLMLSTPVHSVEVAGLRVVGVPFPRERSSFARIRRHVEERLSEREGPAVLALHGTLVDASAPRIQTESQADEPDDPYFPVRTGELAGLDVAYVALGHYHRSEVRDAGGVTVAYAGSPAPVGPHALGPRTALLVEVEGGGARTEEVRLPVPWKDEIRRWLTPFEEAEELEALEAELRERADADCSLTVELDGVLAGIDEQELRRRTETLADELADRYAGLRFERKGVGLDPARADLFDEFRRRLEAWEDEDGGRPDEDVRRRALELGARALMG